MVRFECEDPGDDAIKLQYSEDKSSLPKSLNKSIKEYAKSGNYLGCIPSQARGTPSSLRTHM